MNNLKITKTETFLVPPRWLFLKISTNEGIEGWGEPIIEGRARTVDAAVQELSDYIIGKNPHQIEDIWTMLYRGGFYRGGAILMSAIAGIDQALWDIKGKAFNTPVYNLIGGACRQKIKAYSWIGGDRPKEVAQQAKIAQDSGFHAIKMNGTEELQYLDSFSKVENLLNRVQAIRDITDQDFGIGIDFHGRVHKAMAKILMKELEPMHPMFVEEPVLNEHLRSLRNIVGSSSIPIATGERLYSRYDFKSLLEDGIVDIIQPDLSHAGGITECKKIASMAEAYDVALAPHCPLGPISLSSCLQIDATCHNAIIQEQSLGIHYNIGCDILDYIDNKEIFAFQNGFFEFSQESGLGLQINENKVRHASQVGHDWKNPIWRHQDGSIAEW